MKTYDFINSNIGNKVYISNYLAIDPVLRKLISNKTELILKRLTKGGRAIVTDPNDIEYSITPKNIREIGN